MTRHRSGATRRRNHRHEPFPSTPSAIGRVLREAREERDLDLITVQDRIGRPIAQLEALESGNLSSLPDQVAALSTLRLYAASLGLDGDALALRLIEAWSLTTPSPSPTPSPVHPATRQMAAVSGAISGMVTAMTSEPDHLFAFTQTGPVPRVGGPGAGSRTVGSSEAYYRYGIPVGPPTGRLDVVPPDEIKRARKETARARRRQRAPLGLRLLTWVVALATAAVLAGVIIQRQRPQWLIRAHLVHIVHPGGGSTVSATKAANTTKTGRATSGTSPAGAGGKQTTSARTVSPVVQIDKGSTASSTRATYTVADKHFTLGFATSAPCWVQVTSPSSSSPLLVGVQQAGTSKTFSVTHSITLEVGSGAVLVGISVHGAYVFHTAPASTPFTYTFVSKP